MNIGIANEGRQDLQYISLEYLFVQHVSFAENHNLSGLCPTNVQETKSSQLLLPPLDMDLHSCSHTVYPAQLRSQPMSGDDVTT
jgi:hypothetical protein